MVRLPHYFFLISLALHFPLFLLLLSPINEAPAGQVFEVLSASPAAALKAKGTKTRTPLPGGQGGRLVPPQLLSQVKIDYPEQALNRGLEGKVEAILHISTEGKVDAVEIVHTDHEAFREAALQGLQKLIFEPAKSDGLLIPVRIKYIYTFVLKR
jgi:TonB family protein